MDYGTINQQLKPLLGTNQKLDVPTGTVYVKSLRTQIITSRGAERSNSIVVLAKTVDYLPQSDQIASQFDSALFQTLFEIAADSNVADEPFKAVLHIALVFLSGTLKEKPTTASFDPVVLNSYSNRQLVENLSSRLIDQDRYICSTVVSFVAELQLRTLERKEADLILVESQCLMESHFFDAISSLPIEFKRHIDSLNRLRSSSSAVVNYLRSAPASKEPFLTLANECTNMMGRTLSEGKTRFNDYRKLGLDGEHDPQDYIVTHFSPMATLDLLVMLQNPNMLFRKSFSEHTMFATEGTYFPLLRFASDITDLFCDLDPKAYPHFSQLFTYLNDDLYYAFMTSALRFWMAAHAEQADFDRIMKLLITLLAYYDHYLSIEPLYSVEDRIENLKYADLKKFQLRELKAAKKASWANSMKTFDERIKSQVHDFVKAERFLELSKGSWVYIRSPLEERSQKDNTPVYYFVMLSSNSNSLIYKEFQRKHLRSPNIDKDGIRIEFKEITGVSSERVSEPFEKDNLINIRSRLNVSVIEIARKNGQPFRFFVDSERLQYAWLDGLKMILNENSALSADTQYQIDALTKIRTEIQLIDLEDGLTSGGPGETEAAHSATKAAAEEQYTPDQLAAVGTHFYYE